MDIVERLKTIRGTMTQAEFANQLGIHKNTLGRYERGESNPDIVFCAKVCSIFGISPRWLIMGIGDMREDSVTGVATCQQTKDSVMYSSCKNNHCYRCEQLENRLEKVAMNLWKKTDSCTVTSCTLLRKMGTSKKLLHEWRNVKKSLQLLQYFLKRAELRDSPKL